jgi:pimeloyl-ACP methyl ester carboxylesterase
MDKNFGIVFLHGAGLGSYIWDDVIPEIKYPMLAIDLPNREKGDKANASLTFGDYVQKVIDRVVEWDQMKIVIVAHSIGGCIGMKVADHLQDRLAGFVAIGAAIPKDGDSFVSCLPFPQRMIMPVILKLFGTKPPESVIRQELCNDISPEQAEKIVSNFTPESKSLYLAKVGTGIPATRTLYIKLSNDKGFPLQIQDKMAQNLQAKSIEILKSGHLPMISAPGKLAGILNKFILETLMIVPSTNLNENNEGSIRP